MIKEHTKNNPFITVSYLLIFAIFGGTMYFVQQQHVNTERRTRATSAVSCDYTIDIVSPTPTQQVATATIIPTATEYETPAATQTIAPVVATPTIPDVVCERRASLVIAIDRSGSMNQKETANKTKLELAKDAAKAFVTAIKESDSKNISISVVSFGGQGNDGAGSKPRSHDSTLHIGASTDYDAVLSAIGGIQVIQNVYTCIQCGIRIGNGQIAGFSDTKGLILLTDGEANRVWNGSSSNAKSAAISEANDGRSKGISYYVIGFGDKSKKQIDEATLQSIAAGGQYTYKPDAQTWMKGFFDLLPKFCTPVTP